MDVAGPTLALAILALVAFGTLGALLFVLSRKERTEGQARAFLAGFTYVLSDDPDAAIAELSRAVRLDTEALETYFALGALFRRKGDLERATRLHTNIVLRPGLPAEMKRRAQLALAHDYRRGGLRDKAVDTLEKLLVEAPEHLEALTLLRQLHEDTSAWEAALRIQLQLVEGRLAREPEARSILAHLCAEASRTAPKPSPIAESTPSPVTQTSAERGVDAVADRDTEREALARRAVTLAPDNANAQLALGTALLARGEREEAGRALSRALELVPPLAPRHVEALCEALGAEDARRFLEGRRDVAPSYWFALALLLRKLKRADLALAELNALIDREPHYWEARKVLGMLLLARDSSAELRAEYAEILGTLGQASLRFQCTACRQQLMEHVFRCAGCSSWDTIQATATAGTSASRSTKPGDGALAR